MSDALDSVVQALNRAYPDGIPDEDYRPLLRLLVEDMSERGLGEAIQQAFGIDGHVAQNDSADALSSGQPTPQDRARVERRLAGAGWEREG